MRVPAASEEVVCAPDMLRAKVFPDVGGTWQKECRENEKITRRMAGTDAEDEWWAKRTREYVETELRAELINCMEAYAKDTGFRAPGSQVRKKRKTARRTHDPANLSSGDEAEEDPQSPGESDGEGGENVLDGGYVVQWTCTCCMYNKQWLRTYKLKSSIQSSDVGARAGTQRPPRST